MCTGKVVRLVSVWFVCKLSSYINSTECILVVICSVVISKVVSLSGVAKVVPSVAVASVDVGSSVVTKAPVVRHL